MVLTFKQVQSISSNDLFNQMIDLFQEMYKQYEYLKISRVDFRILVTSVLEISKSELTEDVEIIPFFECAVKKMLDEYSNKKMTKAKRSTTKQHCEKKIEPPISKEEKQTTIKSGITSIRVNNTNSSNTKRNISELESKKLLFQYIKKIEYKNELSSLIYTINKLEKFLIDNNYEFGVGLCSYLIEKSRIIYNVVERITEQDIDDFIKNGNISEFLSNLIDSFFEMNDMISESMNEKDVNYDSLKIYLNSLPSKILVKEEERELFIRIQKGDKKAVNTIIEHNLKLVVNIAKKYQNRGLSFQELISEGNLGLINAVKRFDYKKNLKFSTYATFWIRQAIGRAIANDSRTIRIPVHMHEKYFKIIQAQNDLEKELNREPTIEQIAEKLEMDASEISKILNYMTPVTSLNNPIENGNKKEGTDSELGDFVPSNVESPEEHADKQILKEKIVDLFASSNLTETEIEVILHRFGFIDDRLWTLEEIGNKIGVTRERIRQIEARALKKLKNHPKIESFAVYMDDPDNARMQLPKHRQKENEKMMGKGKRCEDMRKKRKSIYQLFEEYTEEQVDSVLKLLKKDELELLHRRDGADLKNPDYSLELGEEDYKRFYGCLRLKIKNHLKKLYSESSISKKEEIVSVTTLDEQSERYLPDTGLESLYASSKQQNTLLFKDKDRSKPTETKPVETIEEFTLDEKKTTELTSDELRKSVAVEKNDDKTPDEFIKTEEVIEDVAPTAEPEIENIEPQPELVRNGKKGIDVEDAVKILEVLNMPTFNHMYQILGTKDAVIISLALGKVDGKFFEASKIAAFLDITEEEVKESVKRILEVYKVYLIETINQAITIVNDNPKVLEKLNNKPSLTE